MDPRFYCEVNKVEGAVVIKYDGKLEWATEKSKSALEYLDTEETMFTVGGKEITISEVWKGKQAPSIQELVAKVLANATSAEFSPKKGDGSLAQKRGNSVLYTAYANVAVQTTSIRALSSPAKPSTSGY